MKQQPSETQPEPVAVEQSARARLITGAERQVTVRVTLRYDSTDPLAVRITFPAEVSLDGNPVTWAFARDLLEEGLRTPSGGGDVQIWPCGRAQTVLEFHAPEGVALVQFDTAALRRFLMRSYALVGHGTEQRVFDLERGLAGLLKDA
ncbi:SsgA family sporulation/cell division regulator [Streptomyces sp. GC420]|uniref:SsgA family sporulation/cell division regulator n=1 Tax=Streptomyces sp. GC420 TaxID=2697568 RepID=UPI0014150E75|nr:SsgA family sporulation/cell division regulator [Streptomyces sp. GC420]NBM20727.1 SsgA family sporulation/cell division regulator [Streptomyces sp. GC420]